MADNPIKDNTTAQEKQTEALQQNAAALERTNLSLDEINQLIKNFGQAGTEKILQQGQIAGRSLAPPSPPLPPPSPIETQRRELQAKLNQANPERQREQELRHHAVDPARNLPVSSRELRRNPDLEEFFSEATSRHPTPPQVSSRELRRNPDLEEFFSEATSRQPTPQQAPDRLETQRAALATKLMQDVIEHQRQQSTLVEQQHHEQLARERERQLELRQRAMDPESHRPLPVLAKELEARQARLRNYLQNNGDPGDLAAQGLRARVAEQEKRVSHRFGGLSEEEQRKARPMMDKLERQRDDLLDTETRRREALNHELKNSSDIVRRFSRAFATGDIGHALGGFGGVLGTALATSASVLTKLFSEQIERTRSGARDINPSGAQSLDMATRIRNMREAEMAGEDENLDITARVRQAQEQARAAGLPAFEDPGNVANLANLDPTLRMRRFIGGVRGFFESSGGFLERLSGGERGQQRELLRYYEEFLRSKGKTPEYKTDTVLPPGFSGHPEIMSGLQYQQRLQAGTLTREDLTNQYLRRILEHMERNLLTLRQNPNQGPLNVQWSP